MGKKTKLLFKNNPIFGGNDQKLLYCLYLVLVLNGNYYTIKKLYKKLLNTTVHDE